MTKHSMAEQVLRLVRGNPEVHHKITLAETKILIGQVANRLLKADWFTMAAEGDTIPNNLMVYEYDSVPVTTYKTNKCIAVLPFMPANLPRNMGVLHVSKTDAIDEPFVPIATSMYGIIKPQDLLGETSGLISYEVVGHRVIINKNLPGQSVNSVYMRLVGPSIDNLSDYDPMPISADMEAAIVSEVYRMVLQAYSINVNDETDNSR